MQNNWTHSIASCSVQLNFFSLFVFFIRLIFYLCLDCLYSSHSYISWIVQVIGASDFILKFFQTFLFTVFCDVCEMITESQTMRVRWIQNTQPEGESKRNSFFFRVHSSLYIDEAISSNMNRMEFIDVHTEYVDEVIYCALWSLKWKYIERFRWNWILMQKSESKNENRSENWEKDQKNSLLVQVKRFFHFKQKTIDI